MILCLLKKLLLVYNDYDMLSKVDDVLVSKLYHIYFLIMSDNMLKCLETFFPFFNGINKFLLHLEEKILKESEMDEDDEIFIINICDINRLSY